MMNHVGVRKLYVYKGRVMMNHVGVRKLYVYNALTKAWHKVGMYTLDDQHLLEKKIKELEGKGLHVRVISGSRRRG